MIPKWWVMATRNETRTVGDRTYNVVILENGPATAEIWPELGGNCVRWKHADAGELLYAPPMEEMVTRPTRGGIPILFPFPNRMRDGQFHWAGRDYYLPKNDSTQQNAIHGFVCRQPWRVHSVQHGSPFCLSWMQCAGSDCIPDIHDYWPANWLLNVSWMLYESQIIVSIVVKNTDDRPLPLGFGLHPYFRLTSGNDYVTVPAAARWELQDSLPTGRIIPNCADFDLRSAKRISLLNLDDVYTQITSTENDGLRTLGTLERGDDWKIDVKGTSQFREVVMFTPPHRQAICIEPYTCPTDAMNLVNSIPDVGWQVVEPGGTWTAGVSFELSNSA